MKTIEDYRAELERSRTERKEQDFQFRVERLKAAIARMEEYAADWDSREEARRKEFPKDWEGIRMMKQAAKDARAQAEYYKEELAKLEREGI